MSIRDFYGGAIKCPVPETFHDVSDFRPVPDYQEVWFSSAKNESFICEVLALDDERAPVPNALQRFADLADANHVRETDRWVYAVRNLPPESRHPTLPPDATITLLVGAQRAAKFNEVQKFGDAALKHVDIIMVCLRLPGVQTDLLITWNVPHELMHVRPDKLVHAVLVTAPAPSTSTSTSVSSSSSSSSSSSLTTAAAMSAPAFPVGAAAGTTAAVAEAAAVVPALPSATEGGSDCGGGGGGGEAVVGDGMDDPAAAAEALAEAGDALTTDEDAGEDEEDTVQPLYCQELGARGPSADGAIHQPICPHLQRRLVAMTKLVPLIHVADWGLFA